MRSSTPSSCFMSLRSTGNESTGQSRYSARRLERHSHPSPSTSAFKPAMMTTASASAAVFNAEDIRSAAFTDTLAPMRQPPKVAKATDDRRLSQDLPFAVVSHASTHLSHSPARSCSTSFAADTNGLLACVLIRPPQRSHCRRRDHLDADRPYSKLQAFRQCRVALGLCVLWKVLSYDFHRCYHCRQPCTHATISPKSHLPVSSGIIVASAIIQHLRGTTSNGILSN